MFFFIHACIGQSGSGLVPQATPPSPAVADRTGTGAALGVGAALAEGAAGAALTEGAPLAEDAALDATGGASPPDAPSFLEHPAAARDARRPQTKGTARGARIGIGVRVYTRLHRAPAAKTADTR
jgi:hypothetical protein